LIAIGALHRRHYGPAHKIPDSPEKLDEDIVTTLIGGKPSLEEYWNRVADGCAEMVMHSIMRYGYY
jgi:hypothetical protein